MRQQQELDEMPQMQFHPDMEEEMPDAYSAEERVETGEFYPMDNQASDFGLKKMKVKSKWSRLPNGLRFDTDKNLKLSP